MSGLDSLGATEIGIDGFDVAKMFGNLISGTGGILSAGGKKQDGNAQAVAERARLEEEKRKADESAKQMKTIAINVGAAALVGGGLLLYRGRK
jgi:hypothetical protein